MSQVTTPTEPGWLPDPSGRYEWRYWDGGWTNRVANSAPAGTTSPDTAPAQTPATGPAPAPAAVATTDTTSAEAAAAPTSPSARDAVPRVPFGADLAAGPETPPPPPRRKRRAPWAVVVAFFRSFADQPESYHSQLARDPLPPDPRGEALVGTAPGNYGHAMIVSLAAVGIVVGAYLP